MDEAGSISLVWPAIAGIVVVIAAVVGIWSALRRQPPLERTLYEDFVSRDDFNAHKTHCDQCFRNISSQLVTTDDRHRQDAGKIFDLVRETAATQSKNLSQIQTSLTGMAQTLGRLEGMAHTHKPGEHHDA
jgi:hypothetical protein